MRKAYKHIGMALLVLAIFVPTERPVAGQDVSTTANGTNKTVTGAFLEYWNGHGGAASLGLPLTGQLVEQRVWDGTLHLAQFFERTVLEMPLGTNSSGSNAVAAFPINQEIWPAYAPDPAWQPLIQKAITDYRAKGGDFNPTLKEYDTYGEFLNFADWDYSTNPRYKLDEAGIPLTKYKDNYYNNPTTFAQYSLSMYGRLLRDQDTRKEFLAGVDRLLATQSSDGSFRYDYAWRYYLTGQTFEPGWVSGIAQGEALSALVRAYKLTGTSRYLDAGEKALQFLLTPVTKGGVMDDLGDLNPTLWKRVIFEEYPVKPSSNTLNGFMTILIGLYDWSHVPRESAATAKTYFDNGLDTLKHILPYYEIGGMTAYEMGHIIYNRPPSAFVDYHVLHVTLLHTLYSITKDDSIHAKELLWAAYLPK